MLWIFLFQIKKKKKETQEEGSTYYCEILF